MCYFVTGTLPVGADLERVRSVGGPEGSAWLPISNHFVQEQLPSSAYYLVNGGVCDCESALVRHLSVPKRKKHPPQRASKWSAAKRQRWLEQRGWVEAQQEISVDGNLSAWARYLNQLVGIVSPAPVGLLLHWYSGSVEGERVAVRVERPVAAATLRPSAFVLWEADHLYQVALRA